MQVDMNSYNGNTLWKNRYNDMYTFTLDNDGNILWIGDFKWYKVGMPNDYSEAYEQYEKDGSPFGIMELNTFKDKVHDYDSDKHEYIMKDYINLIKSIPDKIDMVDPSGGPYICVGMDAGNFHKLAEGKTIEDILVNETGGFKLILSKQKQTNKNNN